MHITKTARALAAGLAAASALAGARPASAADAGSPKKIKIGIILWNGPEPRYQTIRKTMLEHLKAHGYGEDKVTFIIEDAGASKEKIGPIVKKVLAQKPDILVPLGTTAAITVAKEEKSIPIVFGLVFDPIESGIAKSWESSGNNTTGASAFVSIPKFLRRVGEFVTLKRLGVLYTPGQRNSELQLEAITAVKQAINADIIPIPISGPADVDALPAKLKGKVDSVFLTAGSPIGASAAKAIETCIKLDITTLTHLEDYVERGALLGLTIEPAKIGRMTAEKILLVLKKTPPSSIKIEYPAPELMLNMKTAKAMKFTAPKGLLDWVTKKIE